MKRLAISPLEPEAAKALRRQALYTFRDHGHEFTFADAEEEELTRENCGACALEGYRPVTDEGPPRPNHAGWARVYVEAGRPIPAVFREAFEDERVSQNPLYATALARAIATFGIVEEQGAC